MDISSSKFLVTGGGSGMGRSFTIELARLGADVTFCDINEDAIQAVINETSDLSGTVYGTVCNVADEEEESRTEMEQDIADKPGRSRRKFSLKAVGDVVLVSHMHHAGGESFAVKQGKKIFEMWMEAEDGKVFQKLTSSLRLLNANVDSLLGIEKKSRYAWILGILEFAK